MPALTPIVQPRERRLRGRADPPPAPGLSAAEALRLAGRLKALADPTRLQIVEVLRRAAPHAICQCELMPLFEMSQQALSKHLKTLTRAGIIVSERRGVWAYYQLAPGGLEALRAWLA